MSDSAPLTFDPTPQRLSPMRGNFVKSINRGWQATALVSALLVVVLGVIIAVFASLPMKGDYYNCGTIFAAQDSWTYESTYDASSYFGNGLSPEDSVQAGVDGLFSDLNKGSDAVDECSSKHDDRRVLLIVLGAAGVVILLIGAYSGFRSRPSSKDLT